LQQTSARDPNNRDAIVAMQVTAEYAQTEASRATTVLEDEMDKFEEMKLTDLKVKFYFSSVEIKKFFKYLEIFYGLHVNSFGISCTCHRNVHESATTVEDYWHRTWFTSRFWPLIVRFLYDLLFWKEFRTAAPFYQLNPSQRSTSAPALNNLRDTTATTTTTTTGAVSNLVQQYSSTSALDKSSHGGKDLTSGLRVLARQDAPESVSEHSESED